MNIKKTKSIILPLSLILNGLFLAIVVVYFALQPIPASDAFRTALAQAQSACNTAAHKNPGVRCESIILENIDDKSDLAEWVFYFRSGNKPDANNPLGGNPNSWTYQIGLGRRGQIESNTVVSAVEGQPL
jgi:hypothetical protein